ncbi:hypothetical protein QQ045_003412 [Rhodiola kirilowii]
MSKEQQGGGIVKAWEATIKRSQAAAKKRTASIFGTLTVSPRPESDPDVTPGPGELYIAEKLIVNGDYYTGHWVDNLPNGHGKYLWLDGCMYEGDWFRGKTMGKGKFSWPSGATYEGEFKSGFMDGKGTYIGSTGDTYRGSWVMNLKHGHGTKIYSNGDYFDGDWSRGMQDGQGRYQWKNGNKYIGQWRNGNIHGNGTLIWSNGNRYDGFWEDGVPKGNGTFRWADGSFYVGVWSKDGKDQSGTYYPQPGCASSSNNFEWDPQELYDVDLNECEVVPDEMVSVFPSQKLQDCGGFEGEYLQKPVIMRSMRGNHDGHRRSSVDGSANGNHSPYSYTSGHHSWTSDSEAGCETFDGHPRDGDETMGSPYRLFDDQDSRGTPLHPSQTKPVKRQGDTISKGHKNYELMLNLQLGIRHSVGRAPPPNSLELKMSAFDPKEKVWTKFPPEGSKHTPPHQSSEFRWKDYCPLVFRTLRKLFKVDPADYMLSICGDDALRELSSPGKSGSFFYLTNDDKYMIKTIKKAEVKVLLRMLPAYYNHVRSFENTLVTRFFGLHCVKLTGSAQKKVRFVIMGNLFCTAYTIHRRFDLKGSSLGRMTDKPESEIDPTTTLKDLDLNYLFRLQKTWFQENSFCRQVDRDCDLLEQERIMDYSLLVGVHFVDCSFNHATEARISGVRTPTGIGTPKNGLLLTPRLSREDADQQLIDPTKLPVDVRLGISMAARVERTERKYEGGEPQLVGEPTSEFRDVILFFGIIDILQDYDISKKLEHVYKSMQYDPTSISAVEPRHYSKRFRDFIFKVFAEDEEEHV